MGLGDIENILGGKIYITTLSYTDIENILGDILGDIKIST